jgi:hypothetical protein
LLKKPVKLDLISLTPLMNPRLESYFSSTA